MVDFLWLLLDALTIDSNPPPVPGKMWTRTFILVMAVFLVGLIVIIVDLAIR